MADLSVCIIDDEVDLAETCTTILTNEGYQVESCTDASQALELIAKKKFSLLLVDLMMPKVNGVRILQESKKNNPDTKVIIFTGYPTIESAVSCMKDGAFDYLVKPFMAKQLVAAVTKALPRPVARA